MRVLGAHIIKTSNIVGGPSSDGCEQGDRWFPTISQYETKVLVL